MRTGTQPGKVVTRYMIALIRGSILSDPRYPVHPVDLLQFLPAPSLSFFLPSSTSGIMSNSVGDIWFLCLSPNFRQSVPTFRPEGMSFLFRVEKHLAVPNRAHSLAPTSKEFLLLSETLALLVTDLPPVVSSDLLHRQLQVLLLLGQEVPVLCGRENRPLALASAPRSLLLLQKIGHHKQRRKHVEM